nr:hypothetical protein [Tanacetum cinerariifolium]
MKIMYDVPRGLLPPVVIRKPESEKYQLLLEVPGKGKEKVIKEQVARDLLNLQTSKKKSLADQYIFQRRTSIPTRSFGHKESSSLYVVLGLSHSEEESEEVVPGADAGGQGQAAETSQPITSLVVHARSDLEHMDLDVANVLPQPPPEQLDEGFTTTAYPKVQENIMLTVEEQVLLVKHASLSGTLSSLQHLTKDLSFGDLFFSDKPSKADNDKSTAEIESESMVSVTIQQDMSLIPLMTTLTIDLTLRPESLNVHQLKATATETTTTTTTLLPPPYQQQQSTTKAMMMKRIGKLEHIMANLIQENKGFEQRLDSHGERLYTLEQLDIPHQVSKAVNEVVTDAIDWAMQASLQNLFRDLPEADIKEILHQRMWETDFYKSHEDHMQLYEALEKSMNRDHSEELTKDLDEACKNKKKSRESPKTPLGSPPHQLPPPPPPVGPSGASRSFGASGSSQVPPPLPPPPSTNQEEQPATLEPAWLIPSSDVPVPTNNWASALASNYSPPLEDSLLTQTGDIAMFMDCVDASILRHNVIKPLLLGGPPRHVIIRSDFFFNKDLEYLRYSSKGSRPTLSILKMKAAYYPDVGLEQIVPDQIWIEEECRVIRTHMRILSVVRIEVFSMYEYDYMKKIVLQDFQLGIESYQTQLNLPKPRWDATGFEYKHDYTVIDSPRAIDEALDYRVKEFRINMMNPGLNTSEDGNPARANIKQALVSTKTGSEYQEGQSKGSAAPIKKVSLRALLHQSRRKDLLEIASWLGPTKKGMGLFGHFDPSSRKIENTKKFEFTHGVTRNREFLVIEGLYYFPLPANKDRDTSPWATRQLAMIWRAVGNANLERSWMVYSKMVSYMSMK